MYCVYHSRFDSKLRDWLNSSINLLVPLYLNTVMWYKEPHIPISFPAYCNLYSYHKSFSRNYDRSSGTNVWCTPTGTDWFFHIRFFMPFVLIIWLLTFHISLQFPLHRERISVVQGNERFLLRKSHKTQVKLLTYLLTYLLTHLLHGAESFLRI